MKKNVTYLIRTALSKKLSLLICLLGFSVFAFSQQKVTGSVVDPAGDPIIGASVQLKGTAKGTMTDINGAFTINVPAESELEISCIGYKTQSVSVAGKANIRIALVEDDKALDEVVVIGYQSVKRRDLTGSVASVSGKSVTRVPVANVTQALQGKLPGVNITSQDGRPDASISIRVRGGGSISQSNEPLVLIDGVSGSLNDIPADMVESIDVLKDASSTAIYGARGANGVILVTTKGAKEGKTTVTYNGYAKFNTPTKYMEALSPYDYLAYTWASGDAVSGDAYTVPFEKLFGIGRHLGTNTGGIESYRNLATTDVQKDVYNSSFSHNHDLSITGGTERTKVLFTVNYMDEQGMKVNSYYRRANTSLKVNQKLADNLDVNLDTRYVNVDDMGNEGTTNGSGSILSAAYRFRPIATANILGDLNAFQEGNIENYGKNSMWDTYSPQNRLADYEPQDLRQALRAIASLNWGIVKGLTYHTDLSLDQAWSQNKTWSGAVYNNFLNDATGEKLYAGNVSYKKADSWGMRWSNTLNFETTIGEVHHLNTLIGQEITNSGGSSMQIQASYFPVNFTKDNAFAMINQYDATKGAGTFNSSISTPSRLLSYFGRVNYNLLDRYLLTLTFRADMSSKFAPDQRLGLFPAAALAWRVSDEEFLRGTKNWLDNLKVRASYGEVGNDGISSDLWSQTWTSESDTRQQYVIDNVYQTAYKLSSAQMANKDLKWETTITRNIGVDFGFFNSRLTGSVDAYWNTTKDLLMVTTIPGITGFTSTYANIGQTSNKGLEIALQGVIFKNRDWNISASMNFNLNKGNVDQLADNVSGLYSSLWASSATFPKSDYVLKEGQPVGLVRGLVSDGFYSTADFDYNSTTGMYTLKSGIPDMTAEVFPNYHGIKAGERPAGQLAYPGMAKFKDADGNGKIDNGDVDVIGNMTPVHTGGFEINAAYKNFDLGLLFNWSYGNEIYNANKLASLYGYKESGVYENKLSIVKDCYKIYTVENGQLVRLSTPEQLNAANANATLPLAYNENGIVTTLGIEDGSFLRLNTLTLGYTLPKSLTVKARLSNVRIYGSIYNLLTLTGYSGLDPEVNTNTAQNNQIYPTVGMDWGAYPRARSFVVGASLTF